MASRSKETRRAKEVWGEVMQLLVRSGIGESEYEHLLNHRPATFRDGQLALAPIQGWDTGLCRRLGCYSRWDAAARELGHQGTGYRRTASERRKAQAAQSAARARAGEPGIATCDIRRIGIRWR